MLDVNVVEVSKELFKKKYFYEFQKSLKRPHANSHNIHLKKTVPETENKRKVDAG